MLQKNIEIFTFQQNLLTLLVAISLLFYTKKVCLFKVRIICWQFNRLSGQPHIQQIKPDIRTPDIKKAEYPTSRISGRTLINMLLNYDFYSVTILFHKTGPFLDFSIFLPIFSSEQIFFYWYMYIYFSILKASDFFNMQTIFLPMMILQKFTPSLECILKRVSSYRLPRLTVDIDNPV